MATSAPPGEGRRRRLATADQSNSTTPGWGGLGAPHSGVPLPSLEPHGTFHQVGCISLDDTWVRFHGLRWFRFLFQDMAVDARNAGLLVLYEECI